MLLSRVITPTTRSLTIRADANDWQGEPFNWHILSYVQTFLEVMRIQLPFLVLKSFGLTYTDPGFWRCFRRQCDQLIVDGLEMRGTLFNRMRMALNCWSLPDDEKRFINAYRPDFQSDFHSGWHSVAHAQPSVVDATLICVPRLICKWRDPDDWEAVSRRFLLAVQRAFPPASAAVLAKVAAVHARWCRSLAYPDDWCIFRQFVKEYSGLQPNGSRHAYACDDVDLRTVDIRQLSNMALWGIAEIYIE
ncbi:uncharacterized protein LOC129590955 [Paramacrobiotus metropolitanus]|uniref:uncharacterized protein LOC129590955 n=1 Tax=Paramacrobiotus metropolitanus TaxID=2943436 RepID=UPI002445FC35|nr:uncharacterized protein LOC129590955 [Paramacrobiotus metropolitanus]